MHINIKHKYLNLCNNKITNNKIIQVEIKNNNKEKYKGIHIVVIIFSS